MRRPNLTPEEIAQALAELIEMGLVEVETDDEGQERFRAIATDDCPREQ